MAREKLVYFAKLAEQAELFDEMTDHMEAVGKSLDELSVEERNLLKVAYTKAVSIRLAAWRIIMSVVQKEKGKGHDLKARWAFEYCMKVEGELQRICDTVLILLDTNLIPKARNGESKVFYHNMKADCYRCIAEFTFGPAKTTAVNSAESACADAASIAKKDMGVTHSIRLAVDEIF